jgi:hypothetical protein
MKRAQLLVTLALAMVLPATAHADDPYGLAPGAARNLSTWGSAQEINDATSVTRDAPVTRAREHLTRSRFLDEAANADEKAATELAAKLVSLRIAAKTARERADRANADDKEALVARAEDLEADVIVSEAEVLFKRKTAAHNRRIAGELRARAIKLAHEVDVSEEKTASRCDPPFRFTPDGRKIYRIECLK